MTSSAACWRSGADWLRARPRSRPEAGGARGGTRSHRSALCGAGHPRSGKEGARAIPVRRHRRGDLSAHRPLPRGHGILGELIRNPEPLRLERISDHSLPWAVSGRAPADDDVRRGSGDDSRRGLRQPLPDREGGAFDETDEELLVVLSQWAAIAIDNARLYQEAEAGREDLERAVRGLEATASLSRELGGETTPSESSNWWPSAVAPCRCAFGARSAPR